MPSILNLRERLVRRGALSIFLIAAAGGALASVIHLREAHPRPLDLVLPELVTVVSVGLFVYVLRKPRGLYEALWAAFITSMTTMILATWLFILQAGLSGAGRLVETLPPVPAVLLPTLLCTVLFMRPRWALVAVIIGWLLVGLPILAYLAVHPDELAAARGLEMVILLGPGAAVVLVMVPFFKSMEGNIALLHDEHSKLRAVAERDPLTRAYNRRAGETFLQRFVEAADPNSGVIMFDVDFFKSVNDNHGHPAGDEILRQVAERCASRLRRDDILARWGGEEFLVLIHGAPRKVVTLVAEDLKNAIAGEPIRPAGKVTASFGVTQLMLMDTPESILRRVDEALYTAKKNGRNQVVET